MPQVMRGSSVVVVLGVVVVEVVGEDTVDVVLLRDKRGVVDSVVAVEVMVEVEVVVVKVMEGGV